MITRRHRVHYLFSGTCSTSWGTYRCSCPSNKAGKDCAIQTVSPYTFYGIGHLQYTSGLGSVRKPWYNSFMFKTTVDNRLLMKIDLESDKAIEYRVCSVLYRVGQPCDSMADTVGYLTAVSILWYFKRDTLL